MIYQLAHRSFLRLSGVDSSRFLNGQITQKVEATHTGQVLWTAVTNAKGGIEGVGCIQQLAEGDYLFDCTPELADEMEARLDRYLIADDCEWFREDERWAILVSNEDANLNSPKKTNRYRSEGFWEGLLDLQKGGVEEEYPTLHEELSNSWHVEHAVPRWEVEIKAGMLPAECGLYDLALSFDKGCYIGQEIISRMETAGKTRTKLYKITGDKSTSVIEPTSSIEGELMWSALAVLKKVPDLEGYEIISY